MNIENKKQIAIIVLAVGVGLVAAVLTGKHIENTIQAQKREYENKQIKPLVQSISYLEAEIRDLKAKQKAMPAQVAQAREVPRAQASLAIKTPKGKRAYTVMIDSLSAVGGLISPGDRVDIIANMDVGGNDAKGKKSGEKEVTSMLFQNVEILAVGTNLQTPGAYTEQQSARSLNVTLALSPEEAGLVSFIQKNGKLQMVLRPEAETETELLQVANWDALADYVFEKQGTELVVPRGRATIQPVGPSEHQDEVQPFIQIFEGGKAIN